MDYRISLVSDPEASSLLSDIRFINHWINLAAQDSKCTVIQEPPFVRTWYQSYSRIYKPLLVLAYNSNDDLVGIMPLALDLPSNTLMHAGTAQAEYHGWIAHPDINETFPVRAIVALSDSFSLRPWHWRCLPPGSPTQWLHSPLFAKNHIFIDFVVENSPIWDLSDINKINCLKKTNFIKSHIKKYKRLGHLHIERIIDKEKAAILLKELQHQTDFRQLLAHNISPFANDPHKYDFFVNKLDYPTSFHFTVLWLDDRPLAFHHGACDRHTIYIGLSGFDPREFKHSPGTLLMVYLADYALSEGYRYIDLTPGGDRYKERFQTHEQNLISPIVYFGRKYRWIIPPLKIFKRFAFYIISCGGTKLDFFQYVKRMKVNLLIKKISNISLNKLLNRLLTLFYNHRIRILYSLNPGTFARHGQRSVAVHKQSYSDLLKYSGSIPWLDKRSLLSQAQRRFDSNEVLYSIIIDNTLAHWGWFAPGGRTHIFTDTQMKFESQMNSAVLYDFYTEPHFRKRGLYRACMTAMIEDARSLGITTVYISVSHDNIASKSAIESVGFSPIKTFIHKRVLFYKCGRISDP